ncbi:uncharacterized protein LOC144747736 [Ciona intestinalis]
MSTQGFWIGGFSTRGFYRFRQEHCLYESKRLLRQKHRNEVTLRRSKLTKRYERLNKRKLKIPVSPTTVSSSSTIQSSLSSRSDESYERVKGIIHNDPVTFHFTLEHGLKLIVPPRMKKDRGKMDDQQQGFMDVWTRGANMVNVFKEGSDPKLFETTARNNNFKVKCDLLK